jgi:hypothetical protein
VNHVVGIAHLRFLRHDFIIKHKELAFGFMLEFLKDIYSDHWNTLTQNLWLEVWEHTLETFSHEKKKKIQQHYYESIFEMILTIPTTNYLKKINDYVLKNTKDASFRSNLVITRGDEVMRNLD